MSTNNRRESIWFLRSAAFLAWKDDQSDITTLEPLALLSKRIPKPVNDFRSAQSDFVRKTRVVQNRVDISTFTIVEAHACTFVDRKGVYGCARKERQTARTKIRQSVPDLSFTFRCAPSLFPADNI